MGSIPGLGDPLEKEMATHSSILAWKIPWREEPWGHKESGTTEHACIYVYLVVIYRYYTVLVYVHLQHEVIVTDTVKNVDRVHQELLSSRNKHRQTHRRGLPAGGVKQRLEQYLCVWC